MPSWKNLKAVTMRQAQEFAARERVCTLRMVVHPGTYPESLVIDRATQVVAASSARPPNLQGSLDNPFGHSLTLSSVDLTGGTGFGVRQVGGLLALTDVAIRDVRASKGAGGGAVEARGGAVVRAEDVFLSYNDGGALRVEGAGTRLHLTRADVFANWTTATAPAAPCVNRECPMDPSLAEYAAVLVRDGAQAFVRDSVISGNFGVGLAAAGAGTAVHFRDGAVDATERVSSHGLTGTNLVVTDGAQLELRSWTTTAAAQVGLREDHALVYSSAGLLTENKIGLNTATADLARCFVNTLFTGNELDQDFSELPLPKLTDLIDDLTCPEGERCEADEPEPTPACASVPWQD